MKKFLNLSMLAALLVFLSACISCNSDDDNGGEGEVVATDSAVMENYANIVYTSYKDSYDGAVVLQTAVTAFIATPSETTLEAAKEAWLDARDVYGQTEAYRESGGPIDVEGESWSIANEGQMNAWPIDEGYIDYVADGSDAYAGVYDSVIGDTVTYPTITENVIITIDGAVNDKSVSTGWHAIEFLLWGQDETVPSDKKPGERSYEDFDTADNAARRATYLQVATDLLVSDLKSLVDTWNSNGDYRKAFYELDETTALTQFIYGPFFIAGDELSSERMQVAVDSNEGIDNSGQEFEHSCFSDNTNADVWANAQGAYNVIFGEYGDISGASFYDLVNAVDAEQAEALKDAADLAMEKVEVIRTNANPFDYLITQETSTDATAGPVMDAVNALSAWADIISESATKIGVNL